MIETWLDKKHDNCLIAAAILFGLFYIVATYFWIEFSLIKGMENQIFHWSNYIYCMILAGIIHVWIYAWLKSLQSKKLLKEIFLNQDKYIKILDEFNELTEFNKTFKKCHIIVIKILYVILWICMILVVYKCFSRLEIIGIGSQTEQNEEIISIGPLTEQANIWSHFFSGIHIILYLIGMILNGISYYVSMVSCHFFRRIANEKNNITCDWELPWNSMDLRTLILIASRSSISYFVVSSMYLLTIAVCFYTNYSKDKIIYWVILLMISMFLCCISFLIVTLLPKIFLNRIFKQWNFERVRELKNQKKEDEIEKIWSHHLPFVRMETVFGLIAIIINMGSLIISILKAIGYFK